MPCVGHFIVIYNVIMKQTDSEQWRACLCRRVEKAFGHRVLTTGQFEALAQSVFERTGVLLSPTTLKRLWGYLDEDVTPRRATLNTLARFCGWSDFEAFAAGESVEVESGNLGRPTVRADRDVSPGDRVRLFWQPGRMCLVEYDGGQSWHVVESEKTRLAAGDTFRCVLIVEGEPLYLDDLCHGGQRPGVYVCGRRSGVRFVKEGATHG